MTHAASEAIGRYRAAADETRSADAVLQSELRRLYAFLHDLESPAHHLAFHADGSYTRGEACTISIEQAPSLERAVELRKTFEAARDREHALYNELTPAERVKLSVAKVE